MKFIVVCGKSTNSELTHRTAISVCAIGCVWQAVLYVALVFTNPFSCSYKWFSSFLWAVVVIMSSNITIAICRLTRERLTMWDWPKQSLLLHDRQLKKIDRHDDGHLCWMKPLVVDVGSHARSSRERRRGLTTRFLNAAVPFTMSP